MDWEIKRGQPWPYGLFVWQNHLNLAFELPEKKKTGRGNPENSHPDERKLEIRIYDLLKKTSVTMPINAGWRLGRSYGVCLELQPTEADGAGRASIENYGYQVLCNGETIPMLYGKAKRRMAGKDVYLFKEKAFAWDGDVSPKLDFDDIILYKLHVRGFTKHASSGVERRGTFEGLAEKISYLKELGVNALELMPVYDFKTVNPEDGQKDERKNYWGYGPADFMAVKPEYAADPEHAGESLKRLIRALHREGMEVYLELLFTKKEDTEFKLACLRHWVLDYHVDGFHLNAEMTPIKEILSDALLADTKIMSENFDGSCDKNVCGKRRAIYHNAFQDGMRQFLRGDEGSAGRFMAQILNRSTEQGYIQYLVNNNGFTMMDLVTYDGRHNEANGEHNLDGPSWNFSWNCGAEGVSRKKEVLRLRRQQLKNAWILNVFQQGTPLIYAGDEFGNSQKGNNNAWCQDNEISWLNWNLLKKNDWLYNFAAEMIQLRRKVKILHPEKPYVQTDVSANGLPDVSFHGKVPWFVGEDGWDRCIGCMYAGDGEAWYFAYNMNSIRETFSLPSLPKRGLWKVYLDTAEVNAKDMEVKDGKILLERHSIVLLWGEY